MSEAIYTCPMHPAVQQDHPGECPKFGMALDPISTHDARGLVGGLAVFSARLALDHDDEPEHVQAHRHGHWHRKTRISAMLSIAEIVSHLVLRFGLHTAAGSPLPQNHEQ